MVLALPPELLYQVACCLWRESAPHLRPLDDASLAPWLEVPRGAGARQERNRARKALLKLYSTCKDMHYLIAPLIWAELTIRSQKDVQFVLTAARAHPPECCPLRWVRSLSVGLHGVGVAPLIRLWCQLGASRLQKLIWEAESPPPEELWSLAAQLEWLELSCGTFWGGDPHWSLLSNLRILSLTEYDAFLLPPHLPALLLATLQGPQTPHTTQQAHVETGPFLGRQADGQDMEVERSLGSVRATMVSFRKRRSGSSLQHLRLRSSKTSILHSPELIAAGCFAELRTLDVYPVTPMPPLAQALSSSPFLERLNLTLDVSGAHDNYNRLWAALDGSTLPSLKSLRADPVPTPATAPSFGEFLRLHPRLERVNGLAPATVGAVLQAQAQGAWAPTQPGEGGIRNDAPARVGAGEK